MGRVAGMRSQLGEFGSKTKMTWPQRVKGYTTARRYGTKGAAGGYPKKKSSYPNGNLSSGNI
jgi:hypothetical protein